jgi:ADP-heptose:LPS heptosyltransferase
VKILIVRFSSIGDIVLTTPVVRAMKQQLKDVEIHYLTKAAFKTILEQNPNIDRIYTIQRSISEVIGDLKSEKYDHIIDLHKNTRTLSLKLKLGRPAHSFPKLNLEKWLLVRFGLNRMPKVHVVERYFETVKSLGVHNDLGRCEFYLSAEDQVDIRKDFGVSPESFCAIAIGAQFATKRMPVELLKKIIEKIPHPVILMGGPTDNVLAEQVVKDLSRTNLFNACGKYSLRQSASIVSNAAVLITNDTGMMHIATCFGIQVVSVWGNTVPELGMYPYYPNLSELFSIHEVKGLKCRPCSKIGYQQCPKGHFQCMNLQDASAIAKDANDHL